MQSVTSATIIGLDATPIDVEVSLTGSFPSFDIVGLAEQSVREARVRVRSGTREQKLAFPDRRIIINLGPAELKKKGTFYDLPIALAIQAELGEFPAGALDGWVVIGELSLGGEARQVRGVLAVAEMVAKLGLKGIICASRNAVEASLAGIEVHHGNSLGEIFDSLKSGVWPEVFVRQDSDYCPGRMPCFSDVRGQIVAKRAMEIAAAGGHNVHLSGTPGCGKTMLARRLPTIMPPLDDAEAMQVTKIYSVAGLLPRGVGLMRTRPFRAPHHTGSVVSLLGGGTTPRPGEVTLAHGGVLFLDETPEFPRVVLDSLGHAIENGEVYIPRARQSAVFPAAPLVVLASNPCPCGWYGSVHHPCSCTPAATNRYLSRMPQSIRTDIHVEMQPLPPRLLRDCPQGETSAVIRARVSAARKRQMDRAGMLNSDIPYGAVGRLLPLFDGAKEFLSRTADLYDFTMDTIFSVQMLACTIADLEGSATIEARHISEASIFMPKTTKEV
jgi:magnesium chelatase family protein